MSLLTSPKTTNALSVLVTVAVAIGTAVAIGHTFTLASGIVSAVLFTASGRLFGHEFSYRWLVGQTLILFASVFLVVGLIGAVVSAGAVDSGVGSVLSVTSALALFGGAAIVLWDVVAGTTPDALDHIYRSLGVAGIVFASCTSGAVALATTFGLEYVDIDVGVIRTPAPDPLVATDAGRSLIGVFLLTASLYTLGSLLTHPAVTELYAQLTSTFGAHPARAAETLSTHAHGSNMTHRADEDDSNPSGSGDTPDSSEATRDETDESDTTELLQRASLSIRNVPFVHYNPSWTATIGAYLLVFSVLVLSLFARRVLGDPPSNLAGPESIRFLRQSVTATFDVMSPSPTLLRWAVGLLALLVAGKFGVRLVWLLVQRGWRGYVSGTTWFLVPTGVVIGTILSAPALLDWLRETKTAHYVPVFRDGAHVVVSPERGLVVEELDVSSLSVGVRHDPAGFTDGLALARELIGAPGVILLPLAAIVLTAFVALVVGRTGVWRVLAHRADSAVVGPLVLLFGVVIAAGLGTSPIPTLLATVGAFLVVQLRSLAVQHDRQFSPGAITRRGELAHIAASAVLILGGALFATLGSIASLQQTVATLPEWRLLAGATATFAVVFLSLLTLSLSLE